MQWPFVAYAENLFNLWVLLVHIFNIYNKHALQLNKQHDTIIQNNMEVGGAHVMKGIW